MKTLAEKLTEKKPTDNSPHIIVKALAGTGKTTTLVEGLKHIKGLPTTIEPSPQQAAVWKAMEASKDAKTICFVAFNKSIATELQQRVPKSCDAMTMHSMGYRAVRREFPSVKRPNSYRVQDIISEILERDIRELRKYKPDLIRATEKLVGLCKMNLVGVWKYAGSSTGVTDCSAQITNQELADLAAHYDVDLNGSQEEVFALIPKVLERCKDVGYDGCIDFNDMIWLPVVLDLPIFRYDLLLVDECQDLNRCQQALAKKAGRRLILCGDEHQAIYGFAGADAESMSRMEKELSDSERSCIVLPLTVTRRCGKAIVKEARKIVPEFEAHESNGEGRITYDRFSDKSERDDQQSYQESVQNGDMLLCRVNAPLVSECFKFLRAGRKAGIQGRDVGQGLISTIRKQKASDISDLCIKLHDWYFVQRSKENRKRNPSESRLIALHDRYECLYCFCEDQLTVDDVIESIEQIFTDNKNGEGIKLSSVHKAKGLESDRVFLLQPEGASIPHPMAKTEWQRIQEMNILYVAITRAKEELVYVS